MVDETPVLARPAPARLTPGEWVRRNFFDGWGSALLTVVMAAGAAAAVRGIVGWAMHARWGVVTENPRLWALGLIPVELSWRAWWAGGLVVSAAVLTAVGALAGAGQRVTFGLWGATLLAVLWLFAPVHIEQVGGLYLTLLLAVAAIALSFPLGVLVGIGRVSSLPLIRLFCTAYIEGIRGIPFITVLLWFSIFMTLVSGEALGKVERAMIAAAIFESAYVGETMRGGILSVPRSQTEAARALGLSPWKAMLYIVLPQALKNMIPALVGQFISLFKDTSLTVVIGLTELVGIGRALLALPRYLHDVREVYVFVLVAFFVLSSAMSYGSRYLEKRLGLGER